jgi:hypothetical protein
LIINKSAGIVTYTSSNGTTNGLETTNNLTITSGTLTLGTNSTTLTVGGNLSISGTLDLSYASITAPGDRKITGGSLTMTSSGYLKLGGTNTFPKNYSTITLSPASTVEYLGTTQNVTGGINYGNLTISTAGTKTLQANTSVAGNLIVSAGTFAANSKAITINGTQNQSISGVTFYDLIVNSTSSTDAIVLNNATNVTHSLTLTDGIINAIANPLIFGTTATVSGASDISHVNGYVKKITASTASFIFPVGNGTYYRPVSIISPDNDTWTARYNRSGYGNTKAVNTSDAVALDHVSSIEYWDLSPAVVGSKSKIKLSWTSTSAVIHPSKLAISHWNSTTKLWENIGTATVDSVHNELVSNGTWNTFSPFTLGSTIADGSLPITLLYINSKCGQENKVNIKWATASEKNNDYFSLMRSRDGFVWEEIAKINGAGTTTTVQNYQYVDDEPTLHDTYYKIKQTDIDGKSEEFDVMSIYCKYNHQNIRLSPNPASDVINLSFYNVLNKTDNMIVHIFNSQGQLVVSKVLEPIPQNNSFPIELPSNLNPGNYYIQVFFGGDNFYTNSFIKSI